VSEVSSDSPSQLPLVELEMAAGFQKGHLYELIYEAQDPLVQGVCFAALEEDVQRTLRVQRERVGKSFASIPD
jgi:hypothetical protein